MKKKKLPNKCKLCDSEVLLLLDLGKQPICNRFLTGPVKNEYIHPMIIAQCDRCGLIQIVNPVPTSKILAPYEWITYNEPEAHLDQMVEKILALPGVHSKSRIGAVTFKDDSTLMRLKNKGVGNAWRLDPKDDLGIKNPKASLETIQKFLTLEKSNMIKEKHGTFDVMIVRHMLEHTHDAQSFMRVLKHLISPKGYVIFEVPDCTRALDNCDYTTIWEEHVLYFTHETFKSFLMNSGFYIDHFACYPNPFENSLVGIVHLRDESSRYLSTENILETELLRGRLFARNFHKHSKKLKDFFSGYKKNKGKIALFGAGHLACTYINLLGLKDFIDFCVDDSPDKRGLLLPGSQLPICESSALIREKINLCLLSLNPVNEDKVIGINQEFVNQGGTFYSIFPSSNRALRIDK